MRRFLEQRFQRPQAQHFVEHLFDDPVLLGRGHGHALVFEQALHHAADFGAHAVLGERGDALQIQHADQLAVDLRLEFEIAVGWPRRHDSTRRRWTIVSPQYGSPVGCES